MRQFRDEPIKQVCVCKVCLTCDFVCGTAFASTDHNEQLHDGVIDPRAPRLDDKDVFLAHAGQDTHACLALFVVKSQLVWQRYRGGDETQSKELQGSRLTLANWVSSAFAGCIPRFSHICPVRAGHELPAKMRVLRIVIGPVLRESLRGSANEMEVATRETRQ